jgi:transcriptional regulator of met regulon
MLLERPSTDYFFQKKNFSNLLVKGVPLAIVFTCQLSGRINSSVFCERIGHFLCRVKPKHSEPVLLALDGHLSHTRSTDLTDTATATHINTTCVPPHTTHTLQSIDKTLFVWVLQHHCSEQQRTHLRSGGRSVTHCDFSELLETAYLNAHTGENVVNDFEQMEFIQ